MKRIGKATAAAALGFATLFAIATPASAQSRMVARFPTEATCLAAVPAAKLLFPTEDVYCRAIGSGWILFRTMT